MVDFAERNTGSMESKAIDGRMLCGNGCVNGFSWFYFCLIETIELLNF